MSEPNVPSTVTMNTEVIEKLKQSMLHDAMVQFYDAIQPLGIEAHELLASLGEYIEERSGIDDRD